MKPAKKKETTTLPTVIETAHLNSFEPVGQRDRELKVINLLEAILNELKADKGGNT